MVMVPLLVVGRRLLKESFVGLRGERSAVCGDDEVAHGAPFSKRLRL